MPVNTPDPNPDFATESAPAPAPASAPAPALVPVAASVERFIAALPKVELHVHLEGSMQPGTLRRLADRHGIEELRRSPARMREWYDFRDFPHFIDVYRSAVRVLRDEADFAGLTVDVGRELARQNVRYAEIVFSLGDHLKRGIPAHVVFAGLETGRKQIEAEHGVGIRWVPDFPGDFGVDAGHATLDAVLAHGPASVIGFGIGGPEVDRDPFAEVFSRARAAGLHSLPHAGETQGPDSVRAAIHALGAERIGHGIGCMRDTALVEYLRERQLPLDVSPTSNLRTRMVATPADYPLPRMLEAGLFVTLNSDDPPMFGTDLVNEYRTAHRMGLDRSQLAHLARNGVRAAFLEPAAKSALIADIDAVCAAAEVAFVQAPTVRMPVRSGPGPDGRTTATHTRTSEDDIE